MLHANPYLVQKLMEIKVVERLRQAETHRLVLLMGGGRSRRPVRTTRWLLCRLGEALVSLGRWLQQSYAPCCRSVGHVCE